MDAQEERKKALRRIASHKAKLQQQEMDEQGDGSSRTSANARAPGREEPGARAGLSGQVISNLKHVGTCWPGRKAAQDRMPAGARQANAGPEDSKTRSKPEALCSPGGRRAQHAAEDKAGQAEGASQGPEQPAPSRAAAAQDAAPPRAHASALKQANAATTRGARAAAERRASAPAAGNLGGSSGSLLAPDAPAPGSADEVEEALELLSDAVSGEDAEEERDAADALQAGALEVLSDDCLLPQPPHHPPLASDSSQASVEEDVVAAEGLRPQGQEERREEGEEQRGSSESRTLEQAGLEAASSATSAQRLDTCVKASVLAHEQSTRQRPPAAEHRCSIGQAQGVGQEAGGAAETCAPEHMLECAVRASDCQGSDDQRNGSVEAQGVGAEPTTQGAGPPQSAPAAAVLAEKGAGGHADDHADLRAESAAQDRLDDRWRQALSLDTSLSPLPSPSSMLLSARAIASA